MWPAPFASELTVPPGLLVAHSGVAQMALAAFQELRPYLLEEPEEVHIALAGHSLGGALGKLLLCLAKLELGRWVWAGLCGAGGCSVGRGCGCLAVAMAVAAAAAAGVSGRMPAPCTALCCGANGGQAVLLALALHWHCTGTELALNWH